MPKVDTYRNLSRTVIALLGSMLPIEAAFAQSSSGNAPAAGADPSLVVPSPVDPAAAATVSTTANCEKYQAYSPKGSELIYTPVCDRLDPELGGLRGALYEHGIGISFPNLQQFSYDLTTKGMPRRGEGQAYVGQKPTYGSDNTIYLTYDLAKVGLQTNAQLLFQIDYSYGNWNQYYPTGWYIPNFSLFLPFYDDHLTVQVGYTAFSSQFMGSSLANSSAAGALSNSSGIPSLLGMNSYKPAPGVDVRLYAPGKKLYTHFGVQRSSSPYGAVENFRENGYLGLDTHVRDAKALWINEVGYREQPDATQKALWVRGGAIYNQSNFPHLDNPSLSGYNAGLYVIGDFQLTQSSPDATPWHGWYLGAKFNYAREKVTAFTKDYGITLYKVGTFDSRPNDVVSIGFSQSFVSNALTKALKQASLSYADTVSAVNVGYVAEAVKGIFVGATISYTINPTISPKRGSALNLGLLVSSNF